MEKNVKRANLNMEDKLLSAITKGQYNGFEKIFNRFFEMRGSRLS